MTSTSITPIRFTDAEKQALRQAATIAGYSHLSAYIRDKALDRIGANARHNSGFSALDRQDLMEQIKELRHGMQAASSMLSMVLYLVRKKATAGDMSDLLAQMSLFPSIGDVVKATSPELAKFLEQMGEPL